MIDPYELLYVVDRKNNPKEPKSRKFAHKNGLWHRVVHIWIANDTGHLLCFKRSTKMHQAKGLWASGIGGHVEANSTPQDTVIREISEELGIVVNQSKLAMLMTVKNELEHEFQSVYI